MRPETVKNTDWRIARVVDSGLATWLDLKYRINYEEFWKLYEILEVRYINQVKLANWRKSQAEMAKYRR